jgi:hypothetical protein
VPDEVQLTADDIIAAQDETIRGLQQQVLQLRAVVSALRRAQAAVTADGQSDQDDPPQE